MFSHKNDATLDDLVSGSFLEFLSDDLSKVAKEDRNTGGLLG